MGKSLSYCLHTKGNMISYYANNVLKENRMHIAMAIILYVCELLTNIEYISVATM